MTGFRLYPEEKHFWSFADYAAVLSVMERRQPKRVLEFGPGSSTLAMIEGGAARIDACEDDPEWGCVQRARLSARYPAIVAIVSYHWSDPVAIPACDGERYDFCLIDGPADVAKRPAVIAYALERCDTVMVATEDAHDRSLRPVCIRLAEELGRCIEIMETGPLAGGFAVITR